MGQTALFCIYILFPLRVCAYLIILGYSLLLDIVPENEGSAHVGAPCQLCRVIMIMPPQQQPVQQPNVR